jgi:hypothetical protein
MKQKRRKIATNIPNDLLVEATSLSGLNQTAALIEGLKELIKREKLRKFIALEGSIKVSYRPEITRSRG